MDGENKKKVFVLLYDVTDCNIVPFDVEISNEQIRQKDLIYKKAYIGYKFPVHKEDEEKCLLFINPDKSWECKEISKFKNNIDFQEDKVVFNGFLYPASENDNFEEMQKATVSKMKEEAVDFLNAKIIQYNDYLNMLNKTNF